MNTFDLQIQSTASDGKHTPREIVEMAKAGGVLVIAITDHDTVAGIPEALAAGLERDVRVIPGIEISVEEHDAHVLGFGIDHANGELVAALERSQEGRREGARRMTENLKNAGFVVDWEDVLREATGGSIGRPHIARAILKRPENAARLGGIETMGQFIEKYLLDSGPYAVKRPHIAAADTIRLIHGAGGVAVLSHPVIPDFRAGKKYDDLEFFVKELADAGLDGLEAFNPSHGEDDAEFVNGLAAKYSLIRTAGSDFHERRAYPRDPATGLHSAERIGDYETYGFPADDIIPKLDEAIERRRAAVR